MVFNCNLIGLYIHNSDNTETIVMITTNLCNIYEVFLFLNVSAKNQIQTAMTPFIQFSFIFGLFNLEINTN